MEVVVLEKDMNMPTWRGTVTLRRGEQGRGRRGLTGSATFGVGEGVPQVPPPHRERDLDVI